MPLVDTIAESITKTLTQDVSYANSECWLSLHSAEPDSSGSNEVTTGTGASGRQQITFSGSSGTDTNSGAIAIVVTSATVTWVGIFTAQTGGSFLTSAPLIAAPVAAYSTDTYIGVPSNAFVLNQQVRMYAEPGLANSAVDGAFSGDTSYWITAVASDQIQLSATEGGDAITPSGDSVFIIGQDLSQTFGGGGGTITFPDSTGVTYATQS